jgi:hypothetical protein
VVLGVAGAFAATPVSGLHSHERPDPSEERSWPEYILGEEIGVDRVAGRTASVGNDLMPNIRKMTRQLESG